MAAANRAIRMHDLGLSVEQVDRPLVPALRVIHRVNFPVHIDFYAFRRKVVDFSMYIFYFTLGCPSTAFRTRAFHLLDRKGEACFQNRRAFFQITLKHT